MIIIGLLSAALGAVQNSGPVRGTALHMAEIVMRDPFFLPVEEEGRYYLYGTCPSFGQAPFICYTSQDLQTWSGPTGIIDLPKGFWATQDYWAPEVHRWKKRYYLFATYAAQSGAVRRTQIAVADTPQGPFTPIGDEAQTPKGRMCLDGTLFVDDRGAPWMVFSHEWIQVHDGEICAVRLSGDLSKALGEPVLLFKASAAPWVAPKTNKVTDGPFLYRSKTGELLMLWSSFGRDGQYKVGIARSASGQLEGPWEQQDQPIFEDDGGHAMLFKTLDGHLMISLHAPNSHPSHPLLLPVQDQGSTLAIGPAHVPSAK